MLQFQGTHCAIGTSTGHRLLTGLIKTPILQFYLFECALNNSLRDFAHIIQLLILYRTLLAINRVDRLLQLPLFVCTFASDFSFD